MSGLGEIPATSKGPCLADVSASTRAERTKKSPAEAGPRACGGDVPSPPALVGRSNTLGVKRAHHWLCSHSRAQLMRPITGSSEIPIK